MHGSCRQEVEEVILLPQDVQNGIGWKHLKKILLNTQIFMQMTRLMYALFRFNKTVLQNVI